MRKAFFDCYSRLLIDNHITDLKPQYMSKFSPDDYVEMVKRSGVESSMVYASDHNGNCYYPSKCGHVHAGCIGRDLFGDIVKRLNCAGIVPVAYHTVIYQNDTAHQNRAWQIRSAAGESSHGRYHYCCPNNEQYRAFCKAQIAEILSYDVQGIFLDMTFWPQICVCDSCRQKYGRDFPLIIDWADPKWVDFQRFREDSLAEFAHELTAFARECKPQIAITHQFSPVLHGWYMGQSSGIAAASDYASGDFYGGALQQRLAVKIFDAYTARRPYEFMTSRCVNLNDHTSEKSEEELLLHALTTLANGGAYFFIDAINPDGTLQHSFYDKLHDIDVKLQPYRSKIAELKPKPYAETALYFSMASCVGFEHNGVTLQKLKEAGANNMGIRHNAVLDEVLGTAELLNRMHVPYRIITDATSDFSNITSLIINNAMYMTEAEVKRIECFVRNGGTLIATGKTSLYDRNGNSSGNFALSEVFGVDYSGKDAGIVSYLQLIDDQMIFHRGLPPPLVTARAETKLKGHVNMPDFPVGDAARYASIHSDPPGERSQYAGWSEHAYGSGRVIYFYSGFMALQQHSQQSFAEQILRPVLSGGECRSLHLPIETELTWLQSTVNSNWVLGIVNYPAALPATPIQNLELEIALPNVMGNIKAIRKVSDGSLQPFDVKNRILTLNVKRIIHAEMFEIIAEEI